MNIENYKDLFDRTEVIGFANFEIGNLDSPVFKQLEYLFSDFNFKVEYNPISGGKEFAFSKDDFLESSLKLKYFALLKSSNSLFYSIDLLDGVSRMNLQIYLFGFEDCFCLKYLPNAPKYSGSIIRYIMPLLINTRGLNIYSFLFQAGIIMTVFEVLGNPGINATVFMLVLAFLVNLITFRYCEKVNDNQIRNITAAILRHLELELLKQK